jgi:cob(I)alamin adenosyltransferase
MKVDTGSGDTGRTSSWEGHRLSKDYARMEAVGAVDECNAAIGSALACGLPSAVDRVLRIAQGRLFIVGTELIAPDDTGSGGSLPQLTDDDVTGLEAAIDSLEHALPELQNFIVPGGTASGAALHVARSTCRRAERRAATLCQAEGTAAVVPAYLGRLAGLLFVAARYTNRAAGVPDVVWSAATCR